MSKFTYLVTVETERTTGLIASRDEQSERIMTGIEDVSGNVDLNGIGARSDSEYEILEIDVVELEQRDLKAVNAEYEAAVRQQEPSNAALRAELREARRDAATARRMAAEAQEKVALYEAELAAGETRIWQQDRDGIVVGPKNYLSDGIYDKVVFAMKQQSVKDRAEVKVGFTSDRRGPGEVLEIRLDGYMQFCIVPQSSNVMHLILVDR